MADFARIICSFCLNFRWGKTEDVMGRDRFFLVRMLYPVCGPVLCAAACALAGALGIGLDRLWGHRLLSAAVSVLAFYLIRGIRLFDGFCDLSEGLSYARHRSSEKAWDVIHSHSNGAFAILWAAVLLLLQFSVYNDLVAMPVMEGISLFFACGALSAAGVVFCHTGKTQYHPGTAFYPFQSFCNIREHVTTAVVCVCCCLPLFFFGSGPLWFGAAACVLLIAAAVLSARLTGRLIMRYLQGFNGDVFGFVPLAQSVLLPGIYILLRGVMP